MATIAKPQIAVPAAQSKGAPTTSTESTQKKTKQIISPGVSLLSGAVAGGVEATVTV